MGSFRNFAFECAERRASEVEPGGGRERGATRADGGDPAREGLRGHADSGRGRGGAIYWRYCTFVLWGCQVATRLCAGAVGSRSSRVGFGRGSRWRTDPVGMHGFR